VCSWPRKYLPNPILGSDECVHNLSAIPHGIRCFPFLSKMIRIWESCILRYQFFNSRLTLLPWKWRSTRHGITFHNRLCENIRSDNKHFLRLSVYIHSVWLTARCNQIISWERMHSWPVAREQVNDVLNTMLWNRLGLPEIISRIPGIQLAILARQDESLSLWGASCCVTYVHYTNL
jgi:hypothetical protein